MLDLRARRRRRAALHHDHRERPRHPARQHDPHRPRRRLRPRAALPAARPRRAQPRSAPTPTCSCPATRRSPTTRAGGSRRSRSSPSSAAASGSRPWISRSAAPATCSARSSRGTSPPSASRSTWSCSRRPSRSCAAARAPVDDRSRGPPARWPRSSPRAYVPEVSQRLVLYKRLAGAPDDAEVERIRDELLDRYGPLPAEAENLLERDRREAARAGPRAAGRRLREGRRSCCAPPPGSRVDPARLVDLLNDRSAGVRLGEASASTPRRPTLRPRRCSRARAGCSSRSRSPRAAAPAPREPAQGAC